MTRASRLAVFYLTDSKILRRKVIPDFDAELDGLRPMPGESMLLLPLSRPYDDTSCRAAIAAATGVSPPSGRCCVIDETGGVIAVCNAYPAIDTHPDGVMVASDNAGPGDRYVGGVFLRQYRVAAPADPAGSTVWLPVWLPLREPAIPPIRERGPVGHH